MGRLKLLAFCHSVPFTLMDHLTVAISQRTTMQADPLDSTSTKIAKVEEAEKQLRLSRSEILILFFRCCNHCELATLQNCRHWKSVLIPYTARDQNQHTSIQTMMLLTVHGSTKVSLPSPVISIVYLEAC